MEAFNEGGTEENEVEEEEGVWERERERVEGPRVKENGEEKGEVAASKGRRRRRSRSGGGGRIVVCACGCVMCCTMGQAIMSSRSSSKEGKKDLATKPQANTTDQILVLIVP